MDLTAVATAELQAFVDAIGAGRVAWPPSAFELRADGFMAVIPFVEQLAVIGRAGVIALVQAVLAERRGAKAAELVWTGPEAKSSGARDTAVVLAELFQSAQRSVLLVGFAFDHGQQLLAPLHAAMIRGVTCRIFADAEEADGFVGEHWPFGPPFPDVLSFVPARGVFASLHAKCVVVDGLWVFITSANFTDRGQTRNVEVGVVLEDSRLAAILEAQFAAGEWFRRVP